MGHILYTNPVFKEMIWGGKRLREEYGYDIPSDKTGECWAISAHKNGDCEISEGEFKGKTLSWLYRNHRELFGNIKDEAFPLLVKIIDANNDLSVQVHPNDIYAKEVENSLGKTECWYVLDGEHYAKLVLGHRATDKQQFVDGMDNHSFLEILNIVPIKKDDCFYIPSGTVHAICEGSLIYEAQQSSDITYRLYDYDRVDKNGNKRELHIQKSLDVITVPYHDEAIQERTIEKLGTATKTKLITCPYLNLYKYDIQDTFTLEHHLPFLLCSCIEGSGKVEGREIKKGDHFVICSDQPCTAIEGPCTLMVCSL